MANTFYIRPASNALEDGRRILEFVDSQLPYLQRLGSEGQWGLEPFGDDERTQQGYKGIVTNSEATEKGRPWDRNSTKAFIAEVDIPVEKLTPEIKAIMSPQEATESNGFVRLRVASMFVDGRSVGYARPVLPEQDDNDPFLYVAHVVSDRRAVPWCNGAGNALLEHAKKEAQSLGLGRICLDCWNGNGGRLVKYYEAKGYQPLGVVFDDGEKDWPATVMELRLK
ncbi:hypothetical protein PRZ48_010492 [Zasmidium cellare]|uniref:N-acetyltransferase domain-containing protein n=1 Tax=Zasmidium cellare TaxID=395010 RepID=A0ABR0E8T0_ZASCE|nr:hypothetical protein PRZ48_010492 [Zasmidium cellare]